MESTEVYIGPEPHIEVHKYYAGVVPVVVLLALVFKRFSPSTFAPPTIWNCLCW